MRNCSLLLLSWVCCLPDLAWFWSGHLICLIFADLVTCKMNNNSLIMLLRHFKDSRRIVILDKYYLLESLCYNINPFLSRNVYNIAMKTKFSNLIPKYVQSIDKQKWIFINWLQINSWKALLFLGITSWVRNRSDPAFVLYSIKDLSRADFHDTLLNVLLGSFSVSP